MESAPTGFVPMVSELRVSERMGFAQTEFVQRALALMASEPTVSAPKV